MATPLDGIGSRNDGIRERDGGQNEPVDQGPHGMPLLKDSVPRIDLPQRMKPVLVVIVMQRLFVKGLVESEK